MLEKTKMNQWGVEKGVAERSGCGAGQPKIEKIK
jgi:hypothetical protein